MWNANWKSYAICRIVLTLLTLIDPKPDLKGTLNISETGQDRDVVTIEY